MATRNQLIIRGMVIGAVAFALGFVLTNRGIYGLMLFCWLPFFVGAAGVWLLGARVRFAVEAVLVGVALAVWGNLLFLLLGAEGMICMVMALPITVPLAALGGWAAFASDARNRGANAGRVAIFALLPMGLGTLGFDVTARPDLFQVQSSIEIAAPPQQVWRHVVTFAELPAPREWYFKAGIAYPVRARIEGAGPGAIRYCEFSTGPFVEPIKIWDQPRLLRFSVAENPPPMQELSPYANVVPRHLHGYLVSEQGQFLLKPLANGHTLLEGTTWYRHNLWPAQYWRLWSDAIIHRIHLRVLRHIKELAEGN